jgi:GT2 family glycosyltransferase
MDKHETAYPEVLILCVNYATDDQTATFVRAAADCPQRPEHITVISNSPEEKAGTLSSLVTIDGVRVIFPTTNLGYFGGATFGLKEYLLARPLPEWVIVSNADIVFHDPYFFEKLKDCYSAATLPAVIAPDILADHFVYLSDSPKHQNPYMRNRPSAAKMRASYFISRHHVMYVCYEFLTKIKNTLRNALIQLFFRERDEPQAAPEPIYAPFGAFIILHRSYFEHGGNLDHGCFLYGEEIFVAESVRRMNLKIVYDQRLGVTHRHLGAASLVPSKSRSRFAMDAARYLVNTFFSEKRI